ncbi:hypothetical protein B0H11DRAFT_366566 [Mycena galericulata]|nr:hypothetical protein B0H11DRAFT_366566 [Mycena galericulata]
MWMGRGVCRSLSVIRLPPHVVCCASCCGLRAAPSPTSEQRYKPVSQPRSSRFSDAEISPCARDLSRDIKSGSIEQYLAWVSFGLCDYR